MVMMRSDNVSDGFISSAQISRRFLLKQEMTKFLETFIHMNCIETFKEIHKIFVYEGLKSFCSII